MKGLSGALEHPQHSLFFALHFTMECLELLRLAPGASDSSVVVLVLVVQLCELLHM